MVNGRVRYWDIGHSSIFPKPEVLEIDITPDLRFGQDQSHRSGQPRGDDGLAGLGVQARSG